ncbi:hypothetical protein SCOR_32425 [Sulfidibacter corallicola]|uniref:Uncharacterized protein n=1 Tax=Sulfidibacter corallicola TaxID=2818388 RepID=A0A8A4TJI5_SULCO|nr:hypothetical protein [Sulfidibacter corallicola]QTD49753.1 hypothetical protein J3U87_29570 [Sulfidibacter corallicola]
MKWIWLGLFFLLVLGIFFSRNIDKKPDTSAAVPYTPLREIRNETNRWSKERRIAFPPSFTWKDERFHRVVKRVWVTIPHHRVNLSLYTPEEFARIREHTVLQAALDYHEQDKVDCVVAVLLDVKPELVDNVITYSGDFVDNWDAGIIKVVYSPDGGGESGKDKLSNGIFSVEMGPIRPPNE